VLTLHSWLASPPVFEAVLFLLSIVAGVFGSILGLGGGIVIVPVLTLLFGVDIHYAVGASIISTIATSSGAAATYVRDHITNVRVAILLEVATTVGALTGAMLSPHVPPQGLYLLFSVILLLSALSMFRRRKREQHIAHCDDIWSRRLKLRSSYFDKAMGQRVEYAVTRVRFGFSLMLLAGLLSALLGIGSGVLKVPAMDSAMRLPIKVSSATSNFMIGVTAAASAGAYYMRGDIIPFLAAPVALGVIFGSFLGTRIMSRMNNQRIRQLFLGVLLVVAVEMAMKAFGAGGHR
jgi:uncharacterized protein